MSTVSSARSSLCEEDAKYDEPLNVFISATRQLLREGHAADTLAAILQDQLSAHRLAELSDDKEREQVECKLDRVLDSVGGTSCLIRHTTASKKMCDALSVLDRSGYREALIAKQASQRLEYAMDCSLLHANLVRAKALLEDLMNELVLSTEAEVVTRAESPRVVLEAVDHMATEMLMHSGDMKGITSWLRARASYQTIDQIYDALRYLQKSPDFHRADAYIVSVVDKLCRVKDWQGSVTVVLCVEGILCEVQLVLHAVKVEMDRARETQDRVTALTHVLLMSARRNKTDLCKKALALKAPVNAQCTKSCLTALHFSAGHGNQDLVDSLLAYNALPLADAAGEKPFMCAAYHGHILLAIRLLEMEPLNPPPDIIDQFWAVSDYVLEKLSRLDETEEEYIQWKKLMDALAPHGFGFNSERLSASIRTNMLPVIKTLARVEARDLMGCTVLMHICLATDIPADTLDNLLRTVTKVISMDEVNAIDHSGKTAVDYALQLGNAPASLALHAVNATDSTGRTVFQRAVTEDAAQIIQALLMSVPTGEARNALKASAKRADTAWSSSNGLWMMQQKARTSATFCTCFQPAPSTKLQVRYPLVFAHAFPQVDAMVRGANASIELEKWRRQENIQVPDDHDRPSLEGYDGYDVWRGAIACWVCKKVHDQLNKADSWIGPVVMQVSSDDPEHADAACSLRLFMHHSCVERLNRSATGTAKSRRRPPPLKKDHLIPMSRLFTHESSMDTEK